MPATLRLRREAPVFEIHRGTFDVLIDGQRAGSVGNHETFEAPAAVGPHTLQVRTGRYSSRIVAFDAAGDGDEVIAFRCHSGRIWPILLASIFVPSVALKLRRE